MFGMRVLGFMKSAHFTKYFLALPLNEAEFVGSPVTRSGLRHGRLVVGARAEVPPTLRGSARRRQYSGSMVRLQLRFPFGYHESSATAGSN
jgi:hypothetical protein